MAPCGVRVFPNSSWSCSASALGWCCRIHPIPGLAELCIPLFSMAPGALGAPLGLWGSSVEQKRALLSNGTGQVLPSHLEAVGRKGQGHPGLPFEQNPSLGVTLSVIPPVRSPSGKGGCESLPSAGPLQLGGPKVTAPWTFSG